MLKTYQFKYLKNDFIFGKKTFVDVPPPKSPLKLQKIGHKEKYINEVINVTIFLHDHICLTTLTIHYKKT
jgi:hypothetical protein